MSFNFKAQFECHVTLLAKFVEGRTDIYQCFTQYPDPYTPNSLLSNLFVFRVNPRKKSQKFYENIYYLC